MLLDIDIDSFELKHKFTISRGSKNSAEVITVSIKDSGFIGLGECVPYKRYGESIESVSKEILSVPLPVNNEKLQTILKHGAARNAIDCALWDLQAKKEGKPVWKLLNLAEPKPAITAYTISLATPEKMMQEAKKKNNFPILKVKLGSKYDEQCIKAVREGSPNARIIVVLKNKPGSLGKVTTVIAKNNGNISNICRDHISVHTSEELTSPGSFGFLHFIGSLLNLTTLFRARKVPRSH